MVTKFVYHFVVLYPFFIITSGLFKNQFCIYPGDISICHNSFKNIFGVLENAEFNLQYYRGERDRKRERERERERERASKDPVLKELI
jgi:hypothetical protein